MSFTIKVTRKLMYVVSAITIMLIITIYAITPITLDAPPNNAVVFVLTDSEADYFYPSYLIVVRDKTSVEMITYKDALERGHRPFPGAFISVIGPPRILYYYYHLTDKEKIIYKWYIDGFPITRVIIG